MTKSKSNLLTPVSGQKFSKISNLLYQQIPKTSFLSKSIKINWKNTVLTKIRKVRCPKGRSTALFACQKHFFCHFLAFLSFLGQKYPKMRFYRNFWKNTHKTRFYRIFENNTSKNKIFKTFLLNYPENTILYTFF